MQVHHYSTPTTPAGPGSDEVVSDAVPVDPGHAFTAAADVGDAAITKAVVHDPDLAYDFRGLKRWYIVEDAAPSGDQVLWNGYIGEQRQSRPSEDGVLFPYGRAWGLDLVETSTILSFRIITDEDGDRPAESAEERLAWLLESDYLSTVHDNGLVEWNGLGDVTCEEHDFRGETPLEVLSELAVLANYNFWAFYDPDADEDSRISLAFFDPDSALYPASISISNDPADVDLDATGAGTVFPPWEDSVLSRRPDRVTAGAYVVGSGVTAYEVNYDTSYEFGFRDRAYPMPSLKTQAKVDELANEFLASFDEQDEMVTTTITLPAAQINDVKHGQLISAKFVHFVNWEDGRNCRVMRKTPKVPENRTQKFYDVELELVPVAPAVGDPAGAYARQGPGIAFSGIPELPRETTPGNVLLGFGWVGGAGGIAPTDIRFLNNPPTTGSPPLPPYPDHDGWTVLGTTSYDGSGMALGGVAATLLAVVWRLVDVGEVTTTPVAVSGDNSAFQSGLYLWELPTATPPVLVETFPETFGTNPDQWQFSTDPGNVVGMFSFAQVDYGAGPVAVTADAGVEEIAAGDSNNNPLGTGSAWPPYNWIGQRVNGGVVGVTFEAISAYNAGLNAAGLLVELPAGIELPAIPYPGNQSL